MAKVGDCGFAAGSLTRQSNGRSLGGASNKVPKAVRATERYDDRQGAPARTICLQSVVRTERLRCTLSPIVSVLGSSKRCWGELEPDLLKGLSASMTKRIQMVIDAEGNAIDAFILFAKHRDPAITGRGAGTANTILQETRRRWQLAKSMSCLLRPLVLSNTHRRPKKCTYGRPPPKYVVFDHRYLEGEKELDKNSHH